MIWKHQNEFICMPSFYASLFLCDSREKKRSSSSDRVAPWRVYALERRKITELSSEVVSLVDGHEFSNPNIYHHLLCESHLILRSELHDANEEYITAEIQKHLQLSATTIADFLLR